MTLVLVRTLLRDEPPGREGLGSYGVVMRKDGRVASTTSSAVPLYGVGAGAGAGAGAGGDVGASAGASAGAAVTDEHVRAELDETDPRLLAAADVVVRPRAAGRHRPPGCLVLATVGPKRLHVVVDGEESPLVVPVTARPGVFASFVHTWLVSGRTVASLHGGCFRTAGAPWRVISVDRRAGRPEAF